MTTNQLQIRRVIIWLISLGLSLSAGSTIVALWARRGVVLERERELSSLQKENRNLETTLKDIAGDAYVERIARDKLGMVKEGETIIILQEAGSSGQGAENSQTIFINWKKWVALFW